MFEKEADIPVIELPVKTGTEQLLTTFAEALTHYFAWLNNGYQKGFLPNEADVEAIMYKYLKK